MNKHVNLDIRSDVEKSEPLTIMSSSRARMLLEAYTQQLANKQTKQEVIDDLISDLKNAPTVSAATQVAKQFVFDRELIDNVLSSSYSDYIIPDIEVENPEESGTFVLGMV